MNHIAIDEDELMEQVINMNGTLRAAVKDKSVEKINNVTSLFHTLVRDERRLPAPKKKDF